MKMNIKALALLFLSIFFTVPAFGSICGRALSYQPYIDDWAQSQELLQAIRKPHPFSPMYGKNLSEIKQRGGPTQRILVEQKGWLDVTIGQERYFQPMNAVIFLYHLNDFDPSIPEESRIYAALSFTNGESYIFPRVGMDPLPDPKEWSYVDLQDYVGEFNTLVANGKYPFSIKMLHHDYIGHILPMRLNPEAMAATRSLFQNIVDGTKYNKNIPLILNEYLVTPNLSAAKEIRNVFATSFQHNKVLSSKEILASYSSFESQLAKIEYLIRQGEVFFSRYGGGVGGDFDTQHVLENWQHDNHVRLVFDKNALLMPASHPSNNILGQLSVHTLSYVLRELIAINDMLKTLNDRSPLGNTNKELWSEWANGDAEVFLKKRLLGRLASLEAALTNGVKLKINPSKVIRFVSSKKQMHPEVEHYFKSYLPKNSLWYEALIP